MSKTRTQDRRGIRLLMVDDHEVLRLGLRTLFHEAGGIEVVGEAGSMAEAVQAAFRLTPDLVLMDVRLPDGSGVDACREIRAHRPETRVLFLTSYADDDAVLATILAGAHGFLLKEVGSDELLKAVRDRGTVFEICLTSNLQTCTVPSLAAHPFRKFLDEKVLVTLNTDDPAISNITLSDEFALAAREYKLKSDEIRGLLVNAAHAAFGEKSLRDELAEKVQRGPDEDRVGTA